MEVAQLHSAFSVLTDEVVQAFLHQESTVRGLVANKDREQIEHIARLEAELAELNLVHEQQAEELARLHTFRDQSLGRLLSADDEPFPPPRVSRRQTGLL